MRTDQGVVKPGEIVCIHFDKPKCYLVVQIWKTEICEQKSSMENADFLEIVFPTAKKKLYEWYIPNPL